VPPGRNDDPAGRPLLTGEDVYEIDLAGLRAEGDFFIRVPGVGRSWPFRHAADAYGEAFYTACRGLFHQRCGIALDAARTAWTRPVCHTDEVYECAHVPWAAGADLRRPKNYEVFDVIGGSMERSRATPAVVGGWHDAADWDRGICHLAAVFDLLNAFELRPRVFRDGQLNLPESGNGVPDVLDEVRFGLEVWRRSQTADGGVSGAVETWTHPSRDDPAAHLRGLGDFLRGNLPPYQWPNRYADYSPWMVAAVPLRLASQLPEDVVAPWRAFFAEDGRRLAGQGSNMPYRCSWPRYQDCWMGWGASTMPNHARALFIAQAVTGDPALREAAVQDMDFAFGANPMGMCWTTGIGFVYPVDFQHAPSEDDGIDDPVPGITLYGTTGGAYAELRNTVWSASRPDGTRDEFVSPDARTRPVWRQWSCHPHLNTAQCEFTIAETMSATLFATAMLVSEGRMPEATLRQRRPRPFADLFGYCYLP
jgi:hypothetical protein